MKNIHFILGVSLLTLLSCKQALDPSDQAKERTHENTTVFEDKAVTDANRSVQAFAEAVESFEVGNEQEVAKHLQAGINALANEGKTLRGATKTRLEKAIKRLEQLRAEVIDGKILTIDSLMDAISEAENDVPHKLLAGYAETEVEAQ